MKITIHQPEHMVWLGLLDKITQAEKYVALDTVQYRKLYFQNRNRIVTAKGLEWMEAVGREKPGMEDDYVYILREEFPGMLNANGRIIFESERAGAVVLKFSSPRNLGDDNEEGKKLPDGSRQ